VAGAAAVELRAAFQAGPLFHLLPAAVFVGIRDRDAERELLCLCHRSALHLDGLTLPPRPELSGGFRRENLAWDAGGGQSAGDDFESGLQVQRVVAINWAVRLFGRHFELHFGGAGKRLQRFPGAEVVSE
jgi:hypothetical protein